MFMDDNTGYDNIKDNYHNNNDDNDKNYDNGDDDHDDHDGLWRWIVMISWWDVDTIRI